MFVSVITDRFTLVFLAENQLMCTTFIITERVGGDPYGYGEEKEISATGTAFI